MKIIRKRWTEKEMQYLINNYGLKSTKDIGKHLGKSSQQIHAKVRGLRDEGYAMNGAAKLREIHIDFIRDNIFEHPGKIAKDLNMSLTYAQQIIREVKKEPTIKKLIEEMESEEELEAKIKADIERRKEVQRKKQAKQRIKYNLKRQLERNQARKKEASLDKIRIQAIYDKALKQEVIAGVYKEDFKVKMGQSYQVERLAIGKRYSKFFSGKVVHENKHHITIKNKDRSESFLKVDFLIGEYRIKEVS